MFYHLIGILVLCICWIYSVESSSSDPPDVISINGTKSVHYGQQIKLNCMAFGIRSESRPKDINWFKGDGERILKSDKDDRVHISKAVSSNNEYIRSDLLIDNSILRDRGTYTCRGTDFTVTRVYVEVQHKVPISITGTESVNTGQTIRLTCEAPYETSRLGEIIWMKDGQRLSPDNLKVEISKGMSSEDNTMWSEVRILNSDSGDSGLYVCKSSDFSVTRKRVKVEEIVGCLDNKGNTVDYGEDFTPVGQDPCTVCKCEKEDYMTCSSQGCDIPTCASYVWLNDTCCEYTCLEGSEEIDVLTVEQVGCNSAFIQWNLTDGVSLEEFEVRYTVSDFSDDDSVDVVRVNNGNDFALLTSLDPNKAYKMKAIGYTPNGDSIQSNVVNFKLILKSSNSLVLVPGSHDVILRAIPGYRTKKLDTIVHVNLATFDVIDHCSPVDQECDTIVFKRYVPHPKKIGKMRLVTVMTIKFLNKMQFQWALAHL